MYPTWRSWHTWVFVVWILMWAFDMFTGKSERTASVLLYFFAWSIPLEESTDVCVSGAGFIERDQRAGEVGLIARATYQLLQNHWFVGELLNWISEMGIPRSDLPLKVQQYLEEEEDNTRSTGCLAVQVQKCFPACAGPRSQDVGWRLHAPKLLCKGIAKEVMLILSWPRLTMYIRWLTLRSID